jgi:hypothetical protein
MAKELRTGGEDAQHIKPEYRDEFADRFEDYADRLEAGEDIWAEVEETPEQLRADAERSRQIAEMLRREGASTMGEYLERHGIVVIEDREDLN